VRNSLVLAVAADPGEPNGGVDVGGVDAEAALQALV
jgi:hypothetical protein